MANALATAALLALSLRPAAAHDTWFEPLPAGAGGERLLSLGTGTLFPRFDVGVGANYLVMQGCRQGAGRSAPLQPVRDAPTSLVLRLPAPPGGGLSCWAQLQPFEVELPPNLIPLYFDEVRPPPPVREAWAAMQARGVGWRERYVKHARVEFPGAAAAAPSGMDIDALLLDSTQPRVGDTVTLQVLRDGAPLPDFAVELRHESLRLGIWLKTDGEGRVSSRVPLPGRWVLRAIDLRLSERERDLWESRFLTLAFEVGQAR